MSKRKLSDHNVRWAFVGKHPAKRPFSHVLRAQWSRRIRIFVARMSLRWSTRLARFAVWLAPEMIQLSN
jgi:hypothetical protein